MKNRILCAGMTVLCLALTISLSSCSDNDILAPMPEDPPVNNGITNFFPVDPGFTSTYEVHESDGRISTTSYRVGGTVTFGETNATQWFYQTTSGYDTAYIVVNGQSLYLYDYLGSAGERILQGPLVSGARWTRYPSNEPDTVTIATGETDLGDIMGDNGGNGGAATKSIPITGSNELLVAAVETIELNDGTTYSGAARVVNQLSDGSTNQYWFAPGFGLVRYVIGATNSYPNGRQYGELVSFSR